MQQTNQCIKNEAAVWKLKPFADVTVNIYRDIADNKLRRDQIE